MNGTGIAGKLSNLPNLLNRLKQLMSKDGQILIDSSDLKYIYEDEDGAFDIDLNGPYYGEVDYQMVYRNVKGERLAIYRPYNAQGCMRTMRSEVRNNRGRRPL